MGQRGRLAHNQAGIPVQVPPHEIHTADRVLQARAALTKEADESTRAELSRLLVA